MKRWAWMWGGLALAPVMAAAQILPGAGGLEGVTAPLSPLVDALADRADAGALVPGALIERLRAARQARIAELLRRHGDVVELDDRGAPARRGLILLTGADEAAIAAVRGAGYGVAMERIDGLDLSVARVTVPQGRPLKTTLREVRRLAGGAQVSADNLYVPGGQAGGSGSAVAAQGRIAGAAAGLIDGGVARHPSLTGPVEQQGFARGAPRPSAHGTAVASLIAGNGAIRGGAPGAPLLAADVYGDDPAGGGAFAIARALGWMAARRVRVVTVSLSGPDNPLLAGAIRLAADRGVQVVAAVGNDGPAAPPAYPASYPGVIAVTGIDGRGRVLPEAGRARHVDFAAPGADMRAADGDGGMTAVRGTSFAAPLVAGRLLAAGSLKVLAAEAKPGRDRRTGRGVICGNCRNMD
ncbi:hypothetical protein GGR44_001401 [Sphingobium fontiphilum]|uniref:Peptidase S8/S53 domain-containing protein n=1 Tax=Sphingobium fontiphilum TaxID=944425 RepID=A0A7W6GQ67_9SPHN|nr:S8 family serine peptidase [Sphingobium fontiphilum]MBB3981754.1 hypothetical protein [Sphingobium fontiphilum]